MARKTATIERYHIFGTMRHMIRVTYRGRPLTWWENGYSVHAHCEHHGPTEVEYMRDHARRHGFTHARIVGDWDHRTKPTGGALHKARALQYADFYAQGQKSARMGNTRSPGNEYSMPVFGTGRAWQHRAFADGFRAECALLQRMGQA